MPQEKPKVSKTTLWKLYARVRELQRAGGSYQEINDQLLRDGRVYGIADLEQQLGLSEERGRGDKLRSSVANIVDKGMLGWGGEAAGAIAQAIPGGHDYQSRMAQFDTRAEGAGEDSPLGAAVGTGAGLGGSALMGMAAMPLKAGTVAARASAPLRAQVLGGAGRGALAGGIGGGLEGASDPGSRMGGGMMGAAIGAGAGGVLGAAIPGIAAMGGKMGLWGGAGASEAVGAATAPESGGAGLMAKVLDRAKVGIQELPERMAKLPGGSRVADLAPSLKRSARAARNLAPDLDDVDGPVESLITRHEGAGARIMDDLYDAAHLTDEYNPDKVFQAGHKAWKQEHLIPMQEANPFIAIPELEGLAASNKMVAKALKQKGVNMEDPLFKNLWGARQRLIRWSKQTDRIDGDDLQQVYDGIDELTTLMRAAHKGTDDLLGKYAHLKGVQRAWDDGLNAGTMSSRNLATTLENLGDDPEVVTGFKQGLAAYFEKQIEVAGPGGAAANKLMSLPPRTRHQLKALFGGNERDMRRFVDETLVNRERRWRQLNDAIRGNSTTAQQQADMKALLGPTRAPTLRTLWDRIYLGATTNVDFSGEVAYQMGKYLMDDLPPAQVRKLTDLMYHLSRQQGLTARGMVAAGAGASQAGPSLLEGARNARGAIFGPPTMPNDAGPTPQGVLVP